MVDTAGVNPNDPDQIDALAAMLAEIETAPYPPGGEYNHEIKGPGSHCRMPFGPFLSGI